MQVYAGLLEIAFPLYTTLRPSHFKLLAVICENYVRFLYLCFEEPPKFIHDHLPNYEDDDCTDGASDLTLDADNIGTVTNSKYSNEKGRAKTTDQPMDVGNMAAASNEVVTINSSEITNESSSTPNATNQENSSSCCECYTQLCLSLVTLLFQLLRQWELKEKVLGTMYDINGG